MSREERMNTEEDSSLEGLLTEGNNSYEDYSHSKLKHLARPSKIYQMKKKKVNFEYHCLSYAAKRIQL